MLLVIFIKYEVWCVEYEFVINYKFIFIFIQMFFEDNIDDAKYCGHLYGLGTSYVQNGNSNNFNETSQPSEQAASSTPTTTSSSWPPESALSYNLSICTKQFT